MKLSNKFTLIRIIASPLFFLIYFIPKWLGAQQGSALCIASVAVALPLLAFAEFTDFLDGHYARKHNEVSDFGKMFDPFADVFLHLSTFTCFVFSGYIHPALYVLILYREFSQNFLRMVAAKSGTAIAARKGGKLKTVMYVACCFVCLALDGAVSTGLAAAWNLNTSIFPYITNIVFAICVVLSYISFIDYLKHFGHVLKESA